MSQPKLTYKTCGDNLEKNKREAKSLINSIFNDENSKKKNNTQLKKISFKFKWSKQTCDTNHTCHRIQ